VDVISPITVARFWSKVDVLPSSEKCWEWTGSRNPEGYGKFRIHQLGRSTHGAHRVSYLLCNGAFPDDGLVVRHKCDNPGCVNPHHLESGTYRDNSMDAVERGRFPVRDQRGERNNAAKLNGSHIEEIRLRISMGHRNTDIARDYGVSHSLISRIRRNKSWSEPASVEAPALEEPKG